jgi:hypothetical protein
MLTDLMLAAMESSENRALQYPDDKGGGEWDIISWIVIILMVLWFLIHMICSWGKGRDNNDYLSRL